ncbi:MAG: OB-fold domain-containing protein [Novosphingobium sp.]|nr:OB-fold domain-containing protein [Novosphingobium sp.]
MNAVGEDKVMRPLPLADDASEGFWEAARQGRLEIQRCAQCRRWNHAPSMACPSCGSMDLAYEQVSGRGTLFSWTVVEHAPAPGFRGLVPLLVGIVELEEQPHLLLVADLLDADPGELRLGMAVEVDFEKISEDCTLPQFRLAGE